jgi:Putative porin
MKLGFAVAGMMALSAIAINGPLRAQQDDALLDALVKKGVLSNQEAEDVRADQEKAFSETAAGKINLSDSIKQITFYGDARLRFEYADEKAQSALPTPVGGGNGNDNIVERNRYRLRIGADYVMSDNFKAGVELETNTANDSANQTIGSAYDKAAINVGLVYLQWKPVDWLTLTGGKQRNPLYTTDLVWDPDINPEGGSEVASWTIPLDFGGGAPASNDPKAVASPVDSSDMSLTVGLTAFQGIYADNNEFNTTAPKTDVWQFVEQVPVQFNFSKDMFIKEVPGFDAYMGGGNSGPGGGPTTENGGGTQAFSSINGTDDLAIVTAPGEFDWKLWDLPFKAYWDFAANLDGHARVQDVYFGNGVAATTQGLPVQNENRDLSDNIAWLAGLQVGQNKKKGDWSIRADYRQVGLGSIDPNLNDSDWGDSFLNQQGVKVQSTYNFTDFLTGSITIYDTWAYKSSLLNGDNAGSNPTGLPLAGGGGGTVSGTTASAIANLAGVSQTQRVDVDLMWKF